MTNLLDLPVEVFQMITHELVSSAIGNVTVPYQICRIKDVWKLRNVCRTFAAEIERNVFSQQPKEIYLGSCVLRRLVMTCLPQYMM